jgi:hypothetical protein
MNWFLTELETGSFSVGMTSQPPGHYPASESEAESWVVPGASIEASLTDQELRRAILAAAGAQPAPRE